MGAALGNTIFNLRYVGYEWRSYFRAFFYSFFIVMKIKNGDTRATHIGALVAIWDALVIRE